MLTKTLKFDQDVLDVIKGMEWDADGALGKLTDGQLERKLYERVNKALTTMGGKWNRGKGGHLFKSDPRPQVEGLLENGALTVARDGFFETPIAVIERMHELAFPRGKALEPSAGMGAIADQLPLSMKDIQCVELNPERAEALRQKGYAVFEGDFLTFTPLVKFDYICMNPPFEQNQDIDHVLHAFTLLSPGGVLISVVSEGVFFRNDYKVMEFRAFLRRMNAYTEKLPAYSFRSSGTDVATRLIVIQPGLTGAV